MTKYKPLPPYELISQYIDYCPIEGIGRWKVGLTNSIKAGDIVGHLHRGGYWRLAFQQNVYAAHRIFWLLYYKQDPGDKVIDHIDGNTTNNKINNLRLVNLAQNSTNRKYKIKNTISGVTGVGWYSHCKKWGAFIIHNKKRYHLGVFNNIEDAILARKKAESIFHAI